VFITVQTSALSMSILMFANCFPGGKKHYQENAEKGIADVLALGNKEFQRYSG
jgi:hypothetical protein